MRLTKGLWVVLGSLALALGVAGIFLPLLPATPFVLLASWCFVRGSPRMHRWLLDQRHFGPGIRAFEEGRGIPARAKAFAMATLWPSIAVAAFLAEPVIVKVALLATAAVVTFWLLRLPTLRS